MTSTAFAIGFDRAQSDYDHAEPDDARDCDCEDGWCDCEERAAEIEREYWAERRAEERREEGWR